MADSRSQKQQLGSSHTQLDMESRTRKELLEDLKRSNFDLREKEKQLDSLQSQYKTDLTAKDQELKGLTDELRTEIIKKNREFEDIRQRWKQAAKELGKCQAQERIPDQVTDSEVTDKARQIQYNVRNLAYQNFGGEPNTGKGVQGSWESLQKRLRMPTDFFETCMKSPVKRPMLIGIHLWHFLVEEIFGKFWWGGTKVHHNMKCLTEILKPVRSDIPADWSEAKRTYQMWKANTSVLLVNVLKQNREGQGKSRKLRDKVQDLYTQLASFTQSKDEELLPQLFEIINDALNLDQLLSKQVADIYWTFGAARPGVFNEASMELQQGESRPEDGQEVQLIVAPGLMKRGRSTGEDYETKSILLKMTVSCEHITVDNPGGSHKPNWPKPHWPSLDSSKPVAVFRIPLLHQNVGT